MANEAVAQRSVLGEVLVEVDNGQNDTLLWNPSQEKLRGRWSWFNIPRGQGSERGLGSMPDIPGMHIQISPSARTARIYDPLSQPEHAARLQEINTIHEAIWSQTIRPVPESKIESLDDDAMATWLYWLIRGVKAKHLVVRQGRVPKVEDLVRAYPDAKVRKNFYDSSAYAERSTAVGELAAV